MCPRFAITIIARRTVYAACAWSKWKARESYRPRVWRRSAKGRRFARGPIGWSAAAARLWRCWPRRLIYRKRLKFRPLRTILTPISIGLAMAQNAHMPSSTTIRCMCATMPSAFCAGAACRSARMMRNMPMPSTSAGAASRPASARSLIRPCRKRRASFAGNAWACVPTGALKPKREWQLEQGLTPDQIAQQMQGGRRRRR